MKKLNKKIEDLINPKLSISDMFYDQSKNAEFNTDNFTAPKTWITIHFKTYPRLPKIKFKKVISNSARDILNRRSVRSFKKGKKSLGILNKIIYTSAGLTHYPDNLDDSRRSYPSAGARYPLEIYIISLALEGLDRHVYHYNVKENCLEDLLVNVTNEWILKCTGDEKWILDSNFLVIITGVPDRSRIKYGERGFRFMLIEAGHLAQNIIISSGFEDLVACSLGGFIENEIISLLDIANVKEYPLYMIIVGKEKK